MDELAIRDAILMVTRPKTNLNWENGTHGLSCFPRQALGTSEQLQRLTEVLFLSEDGGSLFSGGPAGQLPICW